MNILMLADAAEATPALLSTLERAGHLVRTVDKPAAALDLLKRDPPDIAIVSRDLAGESIAAIVKNIVGSDDLYRAVVVLVADDSSDQRAAAYAAGADEVLSTRGVASELFSLIRSVERIVRLERRLRERVCELESALNRLGVAAVRRGEAITSAAPKVPPDQRPPFLLTSTWNAIEDLIGKMCSEYLQAPYQLVAGMGLPSAGAPGASVSLTDVEHEIRVDISIYAPPSSARAISTAFCGDESLVDDDVIRDVLLELANSAMGAVKAGFLKDGFRFAASVPKPAVFANTPDFLALAEAKRLLTYRSETCVVHIVAVVRRTPRKRVKVTMLREGMILAADITNDAGILVMAAGTRVTETSAERLRRLMPKLEVELADMP